MEKSLTKQKRTQTPARIKQTAFEFKIFFYDGTSQTNMIDIPVGVALFSFHDEILAKLETAGLVSMVHVDWYSKDGNEYTFKTGISKRVMRAQTFSFNPVDKIYIPVEQLLNAS